MTSDRPSFLAGLGVSRRINAAGTLTRLGGALMDEAVLAAMAEAATSSVDIAELQSAASKRIAAVTGVSSDGFATITEGIDCHHARRDDRSCLRDIRVSDSVGVNRTCSDDGTGTRR